MKKTNNNLKLRLVKKPVSVDIIPQEKTEEMSSDSLTNNELLVKELEGMIKLNMVNRDKWREKSYRKAVESIRLCPYEITSGRQAQRLEGIGKSIGAKIDEILEKGKLDVVNKQKEGQPALSLEQVDQIFELTKVHGIGPVSARDLVLNHGIQNVSELYDQTELLNNNQKKGLKYFQDTNELIPREEMIQHELYLKCIIPDDIGFVIAGSYRRGAKASGDLDIILRTTGADETETEAYRIIRFKKLIEDLHAQGYLIDNLTQPHFKYNGLCQLSKSHRVRRIDLLYASPEEYPFSLLYFTGSKSFNQKMRYMILADGYSLNEQCLTNTRMKCKVTNFEFRNEEDIFDYLGLSYVPPVLRDNPNLLVRVDRTIMPTVPAMQVVAPPPNKKKMIILRKKTIAKKINDQRDDGVQFAVGSHMSLKDYVTLDKMLESMFEFDGGIVQFYLAGLHLMTDEKIKEFKALAHRLGIQYIVHGDLTYNFCQPKPTAYRNRLIKELVLANRLGADVIIHQGKHSDIVKAQLQTREEALDMFCKNIKEIINIMNQRGLTNRLILENSAREGGELGYDIGDLAKIHDSLTGSEREKIGYCVDLCHGFTAGVMDVRDPADMERWFIEFDRRIGNKYFRIIHFNDCQTEMGKKWDHHEDLLMGYIGNPSLGGSSEGYKYVAKYAQEHGIPLVIEAPRKLDGVPIAQQINYVKEWLS